MFLRLLIKIILAFLTLVIIIFNYQLYYQPEFEKSNLDGIKFNKDVYNQLSFLKIKLREGAGKEMQQIYPEGSVFITSLYALSWSDLISNQSPESALYEEGLAELSWAVNELFRPETRNVFDVDLPLKYGAFYRGWSNYVLGCKLKNQLAKDRDTVELKLFKETCEEINEIIKNTSSPYLESYQGQKWPADGIIAVSNLGLYDEIFQSEDYKLDLEKWIEKVKNTLDENTGLIPHSVNWETDEVQEGARGCSQSLILNFIYKIDRSFSEKQFELYKQEFLDWRLGLPGIREYPIGVKGFGDIDSGPVIWEIGGAASIVGQRTMGIYGDWLVYEGLRNSIESFGMGMTIDSKKMYLLGKLPMADAFIAWSNSIEKSKTEVEDNVNWRKKTQLLSVLLLIIIGMGFYRV